MLKFVCHLLEDGCQQDCLGTVMQRHSCPAPALAGQVVHCQIPGGQISSLPPSRRRQALLGGSIQFPSFGALMSNIIIP